MKLVFQMDPLEKLTSKTDSTLALIKAALKQGAVVCYYIRSSLYVEGTSVYATVNELYLGESGSIKVAKQQYMNLEEFDCLLVRDEPPFDMSYITATYLLDLLKDRVLIVNDPSALRNFPEKLSSLSYYDYMVPTCISSDIKQLNDFLNRHAQVVIKPLYSFGGNDIEKVKSEAELENAFQKLEKKYNGLPVLLQKYIPEVTKGDKRVFIFNGEIVGAVNRVPMKGKIIANLIAGGSAEKTELTEREYEISIKLAQDLKNEGILIAGIDLINEHLSEVNITCPTAIVTINELEGYKGEDAIEHKIINELSRMSTSQKHLA